MAACLRELPGLCRRITNRVYATRTLDAAVWEAEPAVGEAAPGAR